MSNPRTFRFVHRSSTRIIFGTIWTFCSRCDRSSSLLQRISYANEVIRCQFLEAKALLWLQEIDSESLQSLSRSFLTDPSVINWFTTLVMSLNKSFFSPAVPHTTAHFFLISVLIIWNAFLTTHKLTHNRFYVRCRVNPRWRWLPKECSLWIWRLPSSKGGFCSREECRWTKSNEHLAFFRLLGATPSCLLEWTYDLRNTCEKLEEKHAVSCRIYRYNFHRFFTYTENPFS